MKNIVRCMIAALLLAFLRTPVASAQAPVKTEEEETYAISLVQTAEVDKEIREVDRRKVLTETYTVKGGDHLWQIFRERGLLEKRNLAELISVLKKLNGSLVNLDLIHPGEKILIPLKIAPLGAMPEAAAGTPEKQVALEDLEDLDLENYTVKPGDTLAKVIEERYQVSLEGPNDRYLRMIKRLNPSLEDVNAIYPHQVIRLPVYSPQVVRRPVRPAAREPEGGKAEIPELPPVNAQLKDIFTLIGEEWVETGEHFIPLKSGGQVNLKASSFPIINLSTGYRVVVDYRHELPEDMAKLIESSWEHYRIVALEEKGGLRNALDRIFAACGYGRVYQIGEVLELAGDIPLEITADWILTPPPSGPDARKEAVVLTLISNPASRTPPAITSYLQTLGVRVLDYPPAEGTEDGSAGEGEITEVGSDIPTVVETLLELTGQRFSKKVEIPVYKGASTDYNLIIVADFLLHIGGVDHIIDLAGIGADVLSMLGERRFSILSLSRESEPLPVISKVLDFLGAESTPGPHRFLAAARSASRNIRMAVPGVVFRDHQGQPVLATQTTLPQEIAAVLLKQGYRIAVLSSS